MAYGFGDFPLYFPLPTNCSGMSPIVHVLRIYETCGRRRAMAASSTHGSWATKMVQSGK